MKNIVSFFISISIITLLFTSCKKYEEGPALTLRSVKSRLTNGDWTLEKLTVDGVDSTDEYSELEFNMTITASNGIGPKTYNYDLSYTYMGQVIEINYGSIYFKKGGEDISFQGSYYYSGYYASPIFQSYDASGDFIYWSIQKLTNDEFWLETKIDGQKVVMHLTKSN